MNHSATSQPASIACYEPWRKRLAAGKEADQRFDRWLFLGASSVLLSEKTGELLALCLDEMRMTVQQVESALQRLAVVWEFEFRVLYESNGLLKMVIFKEHRLQEVLNEAPRCVMVGQLNYPVSLNATVFFDEIRLRWHEKGTVPHEIGVALGYPLDDVFGFMGLLPLPCKGACGWRVYGCMKESQRLSCAFSKARSVALSLLAAA